MRLLPHFDGVVKTGCVAGTASSRAVQDLSGHRRPQHVTGGGEVQAQEPLSKADGTGQDRSKAWAFSTSNGMTCVARSWVADRYSRGATPA